MLPSANGHEACETMGTQNYEIACLIVVQVWMTANTAGSIVISADNGFNGILQGMVIRQHLSARTQRASWPKGRNATYLNPVRQISSKETVQARPLILQPTGMPIGLFASH